MFTEKKPTAELMLPFYKKLKKAWCRESCSPSLRENWPNDNIAKGQCFVTAIAVWETFGGEVFELKISENEIHYYNVINGEIVDLSSKQFGDQITADFYRAAEPSNAALRMNDPIKMVRYAILMGRIDRKTNMHDFFSSMSL